MAGGSEVLIKNVKILTIALSVSFIAGCSPKTPQPEPEPPAKTVFDPMTRQMDRARDVQKTVDQHADETRKEIDTQERGDTSP